MRVRKQLSDYWDSFSFVGLMVAGLFFAASVTPSLLPRTYYVQGILSGFAIAVGYCLGVILVLLYQILEFPDPSEKLERFGKRVAVVGVSIITVVFLRQMAFWQNSIRELMEMPLLESADLYRTALISLVVGALIIAFFRAILRCCIYVSSWIQKIAPPRVSFLLSVVLTGTALYLLGDGVVLRGLLNAADSFFLRTDELVDDRVEPKNEYVKSQVEASSIPWESIGRQGKKFIATGPTQDEIESHLGRTALAPIRVYAGMHSADTSEERAEMALQELIRSGGFDRSILIIATPTGTGWLDEGAVDTVEYLHAGDTAIVSMQYSYLPSWMTIVVDPRRSIDSADALFDVIYKYWKELPKEKRPKLYLQGLSLGSLGSEVSADLYTTFEDPIHGAVWSGPPFPSRQWRDITVHRNRGSQAWLPEFRDGRVVRFTSQVNALESGKDWGPMRNVYIQYASDPMVFFSPSLVYAKPDWLQSPRGKDVSPYLEWYPLITFLQMAFDLPMATSVPIGYGHNYSPSHYIDAWVAVTQPKGWSQEELVRLKEFFANRPKP